LVHVMAAPIGWSPADQDERADARRRDGVVVGALVRPRGGGIGAVTAVVVLSSARPRV
jgi:hypothetical protein